MKKQLLPVTGEGSCRAMVDARRALRRSLKQAEKGRGVSHSTGFG